MNSQKYEVCKPALELISFLHTCLENAKQDQINTVAWLFQESANLEQTTILQKIQQLQQQYTHNLRVCGFLQQFKAYANRQRAALSTDDSLVKFIQKLQLVLNNFLIKMNTVPEEIAKNILQYLKNGTGVGIYGFSDVVFSTLHHIKQQYNISFEVYYIQSLIQNDSNDAFKLQEKLQQLLDDDIVVKVIPEGGVIYNISNIDLFFVGAEAMSRNCSLFNLVGTTQIALVSRFYQKKFFVLTQSFKFIADFCFSNNDFKKYNFNSKQINYAGRINIRQLEYSKQYIDFTPPEFIDYVVTETGVFTPIQAAQEAELLHHE